MPESIDWPRGYKPRSRRRLLFVIAVAAVILFGGRAAGSYTVNGLWYRSLGYAKDVFWKTLGMQWGIFAAFALATFVRSAIQIIPGPEARASS